MKLDGAFHFTHRELMPDVELYVYAVQGPRHSVIIDTGIAQMTDQVLDLVAEVGGVDTLLITHAHADHIGCNAAVHGATGARVAAAGALSWIEDLEEHYREFCRIDALPDSTEQRNEIMGLMDGPVPVDLVIGDGVRFRLGGDLELVTIALPGHKLEEVGFLEPNTRTLLMGDLLLALAAPFFHGFQTARGFHSSLDRLEQLIDTGRVERVLSSHHHPLDAEQAHEKVRQTRAFLNKVEAATLDAANGVEFRTLWQRVCAAQNKELEFRGYAMLEVQVNELLADGRLRREAGRIFRA